MENKKNNNSLGKIIIAAIIVLLVIGIISNSKSKKKDQTVAKIPENSTEQQVAQPDPVEEPAEPVQTEAPALDPDPINNQIDDSGLSMGERNALKEAQSYLNYQAFSRDGLINQLTSEYGSKFPMEDAEKAVSILEENNQVDWNEQAYKAAIDYLKYQAFSRNGLINQLSSDAGSKFTSEQAEYGVKKLEDNGEVDWNEQAVKAAEDYLKYQSFSRDGLIEQLSSDAGSKFTREQAEYGVSQVGY